MLSNFLKLSALFFAFALTACTPGHVTKARDMLTLQYIDRGIYKPVDCRASNNDQGWFVFCSAVRGKSGGLFFVDESGRIYPANGKAKQHIPRLSSAVAPMQIDITAALSMF